MSTRTSGRQPGGTVLALDVDGVLLDSGRTGKGPWQQVLGQRYGLDPTLLDAAFFQRSWPSVIVGREPIEPALTRALTELHWEIDVEDVLRCWFESDFEMDREVVRAVAAWAAAGTRVVLVTNQESRRASFLERGLGAHLPIEGIAYSGRLGVLKSDPAFYPAAERLLGIGARTDRVVFVDDSMPNVWAAEGHGWLGIHFDRQLDWRAQISAALAARDHRLDSA